MSSPISRLARKNKKNKNIRRGFRRGHPSKIDKYAEKNKYGVWIIRPRYEVEKVIAIHFFKNEVKVLIKWKNSKKRTYEPFEKIIKDIPLLIKEYCKERKEKLITNIKFMNFSN